ncbi:MAG TPA: L-threonylcarbamoyladenylate synthase [Bryobacteraceae bacterium]
MSLSIKEAAARIRAGGVVAFPTETVYGLGANALDPSAVRRIYELKARPATSPLIVHVSSAEMARGVVAEWPPLAEDLARRWWPGPLTMVLPKSAAIPEIVTAGLSTVGVRMPAHPVARELIEEAGVPIAAPSANRFTGLSPTTAAHVRAAFGDSIGVLDGGPSQVGIESTVVAIESGNLKLLRPGMIAFEESAFEELAAKSPEPGSAHPAPGMYRRHYSPRTPVLLVRDPKELPKGAGAYVWRQNPAAASPAAASNVARRIQMPAGAASYAARLYAVLHELDAENLPWIAVELPPETPEWTAIRDRLMRAAGR